MKAPNLTTEDLILRPSVFEDLDVFYKWELQPAVTEFFSIRDGQTMEEVTRKFIADSGDPSAMQLTICRKNGKLYDVHLMSMLREEYEAVYLSK